MASRVHLLAFIGGILFGMATYVVIRPKQKRRVDLTLVKDTARVVSSATRQYFTALVDTEKPSNGEYGTRTIN